MEYYLAIRRRRMERGLPVAPNGHAAQALEPARAPTNGHSNGNGSNGHANGNGNGHLNGHATAAARPGTTQDDASHLPPAMPRVPYARSGNEAPVAVATRIQTNRSQTNRPR